MAITTVKVSEKGQIAIPQAIRENIGIRKGDELILIQMKGKIVLEKSADAEKNIEDEFEDVINFSEKALRKVWGNKKDDIWGRYLS
ncbi:AbrB/MazE/SpoVT family DNA-binding domain-containing protein [Candidatus Woesearchaeota archaeon]|nr:AbrB/MazE/SpoVT family DNA-binding domain-containing protein [Candidatus Woesearchaeota archaeon]